METKYLLIPLLVIIGIGLFYFVYRDEDKLDPIKFIRTIIGSFLRIIAAFFLGSFGFSIESFDPKEE